MKRPSLRSLLLVLPCIFPLPVVALAFGDSTHATTHATESVYRTFEELSIPEYPILSEDPIHSGNTGVADTILDKRSHAHALLQKVLDGQRFLESLDALAEIDLPVGVVKSGGALDYAILIDRIQFTKEGARMDVYVSLAFRVHT